MQRVSSPSAPTPQTSHRRLIPHGPIHGLMANSKGIHSHKFRARRGLECGVIWLSARHPAQPNAPNIMGTWAAECERESVNGYVTLLCRILFEIRLLYTTTVWNSTTFTSPWIGFKLHFLKRKMYVRAVFKKSIRQYIVIYLLIHVSVYQCTKKTSPMVQCKRKPVGGSKSRSYGACFYSN